MRATKFVLQFALVVLFVIGAMLWEHEPMPRSELEQALYQVGDLPPEWQATELRSHMAGAPRGPRLVAARGLRGPEHHGEVGVAVFANAGAAIQGSKSFILVIAEAGEPIDVGDEGRYRNSMLMFRRGRCVALISLVTPGDHMRELAHAYARRLDARLIGLGCR